MEDVKKFCGDGLKQLKLKKTLILLPLKVFNIIGYGTTATSTVEAEPLKFLRPEDKKVMNRNSLFEVSKKLLLENKNFTPPKECKFNLSGKPG